MNITKNTDISETQKKLRDVDIFTSESQGSFSGGFFFDISNLSELDIFLLKSFMRFRYEGNLLVFYLLDNAGIPIQFENKEDLVGSLNLLKKNLEKQMLFSIFRKTGVKFLSLPSEVSHFVPIKFV